MTRDVVYISEREWKEFRASMRKVSRALTLAALILVLVPIVRSCMPPCNPRGSSVASPTRDTPYPVAPAVEATGRSNP